MKEKTQWKELRMFRLSFSSLRSKKVTQKQLEIIKVVGRRKNRRRKTA